MTTFSNQSKGVSRRDFLGSCGKMTSISLLSSVLQLKMTNSMLAAINPADINDYKALVCVFLFGGNDSFNMLAPWRHPEHQAYLATRGALALQKENLLPIQFIDPVIGSRHFGVHEGMPDIKTLYNRGDLAFAANIGTLVRPTTLTDYYNKVALPRGLFSHLEQQQSWQTSVPDQLKQAGWIGRMAETINDAANIGTGVSMNISTAGSNLLQAGGIGPLNIGSSGANTLGVYHSSSTVKAAMDASLAENYSSVLKNHYNHVRKHAIDQNHEFDNVTKSVSLNTVFPNTSIGKQLKQVALGIASRNSLGLKRQTFFVAMGGFDHHAELLSNQAALLPQLSEALMAFDTAMKELSVHDQVTTYTASDFGRSLTGNGDGTDHGWGGNQIVMGGAVKGKKLVGAYPTDLSLGSTTDTGRGRQLPTTSVDELHATLANWYGIPNNSDMEYILPNIRQFWAAGTTQAPPLDLF